MKHRVKSERFSRSRGQRKALIKSLLRSLITHERIVTQSAKAKKMRRWVDRVMTWARQDTLHHRRLAYQLLGDHNLVKRLFEVLGPRFKDVTSGFTRIYAIGTRRGDASEMAIFEFIRVEKKDKIHKAKKEKVKEKAESGEHKDAHHAPQATEEPKKSLLAGVRKIFKRERDSL